MAFRFQRRIKLFPGFRLNLSKSGVSTSVCIPGFSVNSRGTTTVGIPGTGLSYRHQHKKISKEADNYVEPKTVGYSSDEVNELVLELRLQIINKGLCYGLWDQGVVNKAIAEKDCPAQIRSQALLLPDLETIEDYVRNGEDVQECSDRAQKICKALVDVLQYGDKMGWCETEPAN